MTEIRRTINELVVRYELEPGLNDAFLEGCFDCDLIDSSQSSIKNKFILYPIKTVDIDAELLKKYSLTSGNQQRVIVLAKELESRITHNCNYVCLCDKDLEHWFGGLEIIRNHKWTKYTTLEMHFYEQEIIEHIASTVCRAKIADYDSLFHSMTQILQFLYSFRCVDKELALKLNWIGMNSKYLTINNSTIELDNEKYVTNVLINSKCLPMKEEVIQNIEKWMSKFTDDFKQSIRGHDFIGLLSWILKNSGGIKSVYSEDSLWRILVTLSKDDEVIRAELEQN